MKLSTGEPEGPEEPAAHDGPAEPTDNVPHQAVAVALHDEAGQPAGAESAWLQPGPVDGVMGPDTASALRDYQKVEKIAITGQMDAETAARLGMK